MQKVVLASGNTSKIRELALPLSDFGLDVVAQTDLAVEAATETGVTFIENALLKARHVSRITGLPAIADDSGLSVNALQGAPGVYSARYAGQFASDQQNLEKLLATLQRIPIGERQAQFHCVLVYLRHSADPTPIVCQGCWAGEISLSPAGQYGFGYDSIFYIPELKCCAAQLIPVQKMALSHRGKALKQLLEALRHA